MKARKRVALLIAQPEEYYQRDFIQGFLGQAFADDCDVCVFSMYQKHQLTQTRERAESLIYTLLEPDMFDAFVVHADSLQTKGLAALIEEELHARTDKPVLFVDSESEFFPYIMSDNYQPAKQLVKHLIEQHGFTDIAYLTGTEFHPHAKQRLQAYYDCMAEHNLEVKDNRVFYGDFWIYSGARVVEQLLKDRENLPQAVACANDFMAIGLIREFEKNGIRVPEDVAVTGFDARVESREFVVPVTTLAMPLVAYGKYAWNCLQAIAKGSELPAFSPVYTPIVRSSCGCEYLGDPENYEEPLDRNATLVYFDFNESTMADGMMEQTELSGIVSTIYSYIHEIRPFESFHLCLNSDWKDEVFLSNGVCSNYSEQMLHVLCCGPQESDDRVDMNIRFDRKQLLPELQEMSREPRAFYFTPLFYEEHCFGYAVVGYGESTRPFGAVYKRWLNTVMHGLECFLRFRMLSAQNEKLERDQIRDGLTGLYSYQGFLKTVLSGVRELKSENVNMDVAVVELSGINEIYMQFGNYSGNKVLVDFAQMMFVASKQELLCYIGNGEFIIGLLSVDDGQSLLEQAKENMKEKLADYCSRNGLEGKLSPIFGMASGYVDGEERLGSLVGEAVGRKNANKLQKLRRGGDVMTEDEFHKMKLVKEILDDNLLTYHFQPIVDSSSGEIYAYEALMRSNTEEPVTPLEILKYAEYLDRLDDVETATFANVINYVKENPERFENKKVFINSIPGAQIPEEIEAALQEQIKALDGKTVVELTEQAEVDDETLAALKRKFENMGVDTAIDDYGTGYSNVYNLLRYMPQYVKIDRMLLANIQLSAQKQHFVKEIIEFSHNNRITVLAEGVETAEELKMLISLGADLIQGYYTARPEKEVLQKIDYKVRTEIIQFAQYALVKNSEKTFMAGEEGMISLVKVATGHFSKIKFSEGEIRHRNVAIVGFQGFSANVEIEIDDGYSGRIELKDVDLSVHNDRPAIKIGENCDVTLVLRGENILEQGGILVPESSELTIKGDGNLYIKHIAVNGYGIGNDNESRHGKLYFDQDGTIDIRGNTVFSVGIGSGLGGVIHMNRGGYMIQLSGMDAVAIGSLTGDTEILSYNCAVDVNISSSANVGVGSLKGNANLDFSFMRMKSYQSGNQCVGIGTLENGGLTFCLKQAFIEFDGRANQLSAIGSLYGDVDIDATEYSFRINADGKEAIALGNLTKTAIFRTSSSDIRMTVNNDLDYDIGAATVEMQEVYAEVILNGNKIVRERPDAAD